MSETEPIQVRRQEAPRILLEALTQMAADAPAGVPDAWDFEDRALDAYVRLPAVSTLPLTALLEAAEAADIPSEYVESARKTLVERRRMRAWMWLGIFVLLGLLSYLIWFR